MTDDHTRRADVLAALDTEPDEPGVQTGLEDAPVPHIWRERISAFLLGLLGLLGGVLLNEVIRAIVR